RKGNGFFKWRRESAKRAIQEAQSALRLLFRLAYGASINYLAIVAVALTCVIFAAKQEIISTTQPTPDLPARIAAPDQLDNIDIENSATRDAEKLPADRQLNRSNFERITNLAQQRDKSLRATREQTQKQVANREKQAALLRIPPQEQQITKQLQSPEVRENLEKQAVQPLESQTQTGALTGTPASTAKRAERNLAEPVNLQIGRVLKREGVLDGYFEAQVFDVINGDDLSQSSQPPIDPQGELDPERYVELEINVTGQAVRLLRLANAHVNPQSIQAFDQNNQPVLVKRVTTDAFGFTRVEFNQATNGTIRFTIHPQKRSNQPENQALTRHYQQSRPAEPLNLPRELEQIISQDGTRREKTTAIVNYLSTHYTYDTSPATERELRDSAGSMVNAFFRLGQGDCEDFNLALVTILRSSGIPSRVVEGYLYELNTGSYHRRVEVLLENGEWQRFDATAAGPARASGNSQEVRGNPYVPEIHNWPDTPETFWRLRTRLDAEFRELSFERNAVRNRLFEVGFALGDQYLDLAITVFLADAARSDLARGLHNSFIEMDFREWLGDHWRTNLSEENYEFIRAQVHQRIRGVLNDPSTPSNIRSGYIRAYEMTENVDTYYERGWLTPADYLAVRIHQAFNEDGGRPLTDLVDRPEIRSVANDPEFIRQFLASHSGAGPVFEQNFLPFFFNSLAHDNQVTSTFNYLTGQQITNGSMQFMAYLAYRTGNPTLRQRAQAIWLNILSHANDYRDFEGQILGVHTQISESHLNYLLYLNHTPQLMREAFLDYDPNPAYLTGRLRMVLPLFEPDVRQEIFAPYLDDLFVPLQTMLAATYVDLTQQDDYYRDLLETTLALEEIEPRFRPLAQEAARRYHETITDSDHNIFSLDLNFLGALLHLSADGLGQQIAIDLLRRTDFEQPWQLEEVVGAMGREENQTFRLSSLTASGFLTSDKMLSRYNQLRLDLALANGQTPDQIAGPIYQSGRLLGLRHWPGLWPQLILADLRDQLASEERGFGLGAPLRAEIEQILAQYSHAPTETSLTDLLYADLLAEPGLPPATANLYLDTLARALEISPPTEADFSTLMEIARRYGRTLIPAIFSPRQEITEDN
ncbi:hypothetical protein COT42_06100, partial [Candidatus Saganbacteria bacterium CG08_land_8_20_14_0_20_45_16]